MTRQRSVVAGLLAVIVITGRDAPAAVDGTGYDPECGVEVQFSRDGEIQVQWQSGPAESLHLSFNTRPGQPLVSSVRFSSQGRGMAELKRDVHPVTFVTVGTRKSPPGRPPGMSVFNVFFDSPATRPHETYLATLEPKNVRVVSKGHHATLIFDGMRAGPFTGELHITLYRNAPLIQVESVLTTEREETAYVYDAGLVSSTGSWSQVAWMDTEGRLRRRLIGTSPPDRAEMVRHRTIVHETGSGSIACFPPPHQYFYPRDLTDNQSTVWSGQGHRKLEARNGFGIQQTERGGGSFVPWFNAPPGTAQRMGVFYLVSGGKADDAIRETLRYTHGDRFPKLPGHVTFTSHWHMAIAVAAMQEQARGGTRTIPDFVRMFKDMGVNLVHLAEFHGDGHQFDPGPLRIPELEAMFAECRRLSDAQLVFLPGEEVSTYLGVTRPGQHPGHWMSFFPKPVYWTIKRGAGQPFAEEDPKHGMVYHVGSHEDMTRLLEREHGLVWTAHPRIKASNWAPDAFRDQNYYKADTWLGGAWKAMPADLSSPRLGVRCLDLLDDMANWGQQKYLPGEVDVFKLDHTHELYGHMNVNYLRLERLPRFDEGWQSVLDTLRAGRFFVTTGEVLLQDFTVGGKSSGETLTLGSQASPEIKMSVEWTFPLRFAEIVSGDGTKVYRHRIDLSDTDPFEQRTLTFTPELGSRKWVRVEAWDIAGNGTYSQPVWLR